jgi:hypothetical protein
MTGFRAAAAVAFLSAGALVTTAPRARADGIPGFDPSLFADPSSLISQNVANTLITVLGLATDHRPYEPATALGTAVGLSIGTEVTLVKIPPSLAQALEDSGAGDVETPPIVPVPRLQVHKGLSPYAEVGGSWISYQGYRVYGGDGQLTVWQPEEGPTVALRFSYTDAKLGFAHTRTWSPAIVVSRALDFADPYIGAAYEYTKGRLEFTQDVLGFPVSVKKDGYGHGFLAFTGVQMRVPVLGVQLTLEGAWSSAGLDSLGTKVGLRF